MNLQPHQQRVVEEKEQVSERLSKLLAFFQGSIFHTLPAAERARLRSQARFMDGYAAVLEDRIVAFSEQPAQDPLEPAITQLGICAETCETNAPIHEAEGRTEQAALSRANAASYRAAIERLSA